MRVTVVGCAGSFPGPDSSASCYLIEQETVDDLGETRIWRIVVDMGSGSFGPLQQYVDPLSIDAVFLSHLHADHCLDMTGFWVMRKFHPTGHQPRIPVWGPADTPGRLARGYDLAEDPGMSEEFDFRPHGGVVELGPFRVESALVEHPVDAYALRITAGGTSVAYSGDTGPCQALDDLAAGADLYLCEASFREGRPNPPQLHLTGSECGASATAAGVGRLVVTHVPPWHDPKVALEEARTTWDGPIELAVPGAVYTV